MPDSIGMPCRLARRSANVESRSSLLAAPCPHLAGVGAELAIASPDAPREPATTARRRTAGGAHHAGDLSGELLPDGVEESCRPVADHKLRRPFVGRGNQFQSAAGNLFCYLPGQVFPRRREQIFPFSRVMRSEEHTSELQSRLHLVC